MSIDVPVVEIKKTSAAEDFNFIDTYVEFITEAIFKYENAIPETRHRHHRELQAHQQVQVICQQISILLTAGIITSPQDNGYPAYINNYAFHFVKELNHPPSQA